MKIAIVYFSSSGNTKTMADLLAQSLRSRGCRVLITSLEDARLSDVSDAEVVLFGSPAWSGERVAQPLVDFVNDVAGHLRARKVAFFGSYDWGEGEYFDALAAELRAGGVAVHETPLLTKQGDKPLDAAGAEAFLTALVG